MQYRIGEFAELSGVSAKTLRFYDRIGLLQPATINPRTRYRGYAPEQLQELASILALKDLGVSLGQLRELVKSKASTADRRVVLTGLKQQMQQLIDTATQSIDRIDAALGELEATQASIPVVVKRRPALLVASMRTKVDTYSQMSRYEQELLDALPVEAAGDQRGVLWHRCADSGSLEGEPFVALRRRLPRQSFFDVKQLPPATVACAYSACDDASAEQAYLALRRWMNVRGFTLAAPKRELYVGHLLEIQFPLAVE